MRMLRTDVEAYLDPIRVERKIPPIYMRLT